MVVLIMTLRNAAPLRTLPITFRLLSLAAAMLGTTALGTSAHAETLKEALAHTYQDNPTLAAARAGLRATDENVPLQKAQALPSASLSGTYTEFVKQSLSSVTSPSRQFSGNIDLSVPIYSGGGTKNNILAAKTRVEAGRAELRGMESQIFSRVVASYMDVIQQEAIVSLADSNVGVLETNLEATSDRFEIGDLTRTDVAQSESRLALARGDLRSAQANLVSARENYIALVGKAPTDLQAPPPLPGLPSNPNNAVDIALEYNPDLIAAYERVTAAGFDVKSAGAGRLPRLEAFTTGGYQNYLGSLGSIPGTAAASQSSTSAQAGFRLSVPLFQGGRVAAQQRQAGAQATATMENAIATERDVIANVRASYSSWRASNAIIASSQAAVSAAELSLEGVRAENSVGNRTILDILNAQQELLSARVQLVRARRNEYVAGFTVLAAMGKAEARDLGLETAGPLYDPTVNYDRVEGIIWDWQQDDPSEAQSSRTIDIKAPDGEISVSN